MFRSEEAYSIRKLREATISFLALWYFKFHVRCATIQNICLFFGKYMYFFYFVFLKGLYLKKK